MFTIFSLTLRIGAPTIRLLATSDDGTTSDVTATIKDGDDAVIPPNRSEASENKTDSP
jgi:hypothetical protein